MVTGMLLSTPTAAETFFNYETEFSGPPERISFGWSKKLTDLQMEYYTASMAHALLYAEDGERVYWSSGNINGYAVSALTNPRGHYYCRHIHAEVNGYGEKKVFAQTACHTYSTGVWRWVANR
jgi:hypothetical protein